MNYEIRQRIVRIVCELLLDKIDNIAIGDNTRLIEDLGFDSVTIISFILLLEEEFDFNFSDNENLIEIFKCIGSVQNYIERTLQYD